MMNITNNSTASRTVDNYHCTVCLSQFNSLSNYSIHLLELSAADQLTHRNGFKSTEQQQLQLQQQQQQQQQQQDYKSNSIKSNINYCTLCDIQCNSINSYISHIAGKSHQRQLALQEQFKSKSKSATATGTGTGTAASVSITQSQPVIPLLDCDICSVKCSNISSINQHLSGSKHKNAVLAQSKSAIAIIIKTESTPVQQSVWPCTICSIECHSLIDYNKHINGSKHQKKIQLPTGTAPAPAPATATATQSIITPNKSAVAPAPASVSVYSSVYASLPTMNTVSAAVPISAAAAIATSGSGLRSVPAIVPLAVGIKSATASTTVSTSSVNHESEFRNLIGSVIISVLSDPNQCNQWIQTNIFNTDCNHIGFDTESKPSFTAEMVQKLSIIQLSTPTHCLIYRVFKLNKLQWPSKLIQLLESKSIAKYCVDINGDSRLLNQLGIQLELMIDIQLYHHRQYNTISKLGLKKLSKLLLELEFSKPKKLSKSNWSQWPLKPNQINYAAIDAILSLSIGKALKLAIQNQSATDAYKQYLTLINKPINRTDDRITESKLESKSDEY